MERFATSKSFIWCFIKVFSLYSAECIIIKLFNHGHVTERIERLGDNWEGFFRYLIELLDSAAAVYSKNTAEVVISRIDFVCCILRQILPNFEGQAENTQFINDILENLNLIATEISTSFLNLGCFPSSPAVISFESPPVHQHSQRGHPKFEITKEALIGLREIGHSWNTIAKMFLVSRWTILRRVNEYN